MSLAVLAPACGALAAQEQHSLKPVGKVSAPITLVKDGRPNYRILVRRQASTQERKAAQDLQHWIREMTGAELRIATSPPSRALVRVVVSRPSGALVRIATDRRLADEAYRVALDGKNLVLSGGARGGA